MSDAYAKVMALKLAQAQAKQRTMKPIKVGQQILREWAGSHQAVLDPCMAADLVKRIEAAIVAERVSITLATGATDG